MRKTLTLGPLPIVFANQNPDLGIPLHHHAAQVHLSYAFTGDAAFPVLAKTMDEVRERLDGVVREPFMNARNEHVLEAIYRAFRDWRCDELADDPGEWDLVAVALTVLGTRDRFGHADGTATYRLDV